MKIIKLAFWMVAKIRIGEKYDDNKVGVLRGGKNQDLIEASQKNHILEAGQS